MTRLLADRTILVVEDEMLVLINIEAALDELGYAAITGAADVQQALSPISSGDFDAAGTVDRRWLVVPHPLSQA